MLVSRNDLVKRKDCPFDIASLIPILCIVVQSIWVSYTSRPVEVEDHQVICLRVNKKVPRRNVLVLYPVFEIQIVDNVKQLFEPLELENTCRVCLKCSPWDKATGKTDPDLSAVELVHHESVKWRDVWVRWQTHPYLELVPAPEYEMLYEVVLESNLFVPSLPCGCGLAVVAHEVDVRPQSVYLHEVRAMNSFGIWKDCNLVQSWKVKAERFVVVRIVGSRDQVTFMGHVNGIDVRLKLVDVFPNVCCKSASAPGMLLLDTFTGKPWGIPAAISSSSTSSAICTDTVRRCSQSRTSFPSAGAAGRDGATERKESVSLLDHLANEICIRPSGQF